MPCETERGCPYAPSPGREGALLPGNVLAVWVWERLRTLGPAVWDLLDLPLTPADASLLAEQVHVLIDYSAYLDALRRQNGHG